MLGQEARPPAPPTPISALISLEHHCLGTSPCPPLDCESRSLLGSQPWGQTEQVFLGKE